MTMRLARAVLALPLSLPLALTACGDVTTAPGEANLPAGSWQTQQLAAELGADQPPLLAISGEDALVLAVSEEGTLRSHVSLAGQRFEAGEPLPIETDHVLLADVVALPGGGWFALGSGGSVEKDGDTELTFEPVAFRSADGLAWEQVAVTGFAHPVEVNDLAVVDGTIVAAGSYRSATGPAEGGFEAHLWTSTDAAAFTQIDLPDVLAPGDYDHESYAGHLALIGDRVLASGRVGRSAAVWTSDDATRTWKRVSDPTLADTYSISGLQAVGNVLVAGVGEGSVTALRSTDQGDSWSPVSSLKVSSEEAGWAPVWADEERFWTLTGVDDMSWGKPEACYADLDQCGKNPEPSVVTSTTGSDWTAAKLPGEIGTLAGTTDGRTLAVGISRRGIVVHTLPAGTSPPAAPAETEPKTVKLVTVKEGEQPEVGVRYHAPMYLHCGMDWFFLGDTSWRRTDHGPDIETGAGDGPTEGWPLVGQSLYGFATLTDADHLDYSIGDGEVIASYVRDTGAPGCD